MLMSVVVGNVVCVPISYTFKCKTRSCWIVRVNKQTNQIGEKRVEKLERKTNQKMLYD